MLKRLISAVIIVCLAGLFSSVSAGQFDNIISAADVEKATGLTGVKKVPRDKAAPGYTENKLLTGDINFVRSDGQPILMIQFRPAFVYDQFKADTEYNKGAVPGIGSDAFSSPVYPPQYTINFVKGNYYAAVTTHLDPKNESKTLIPFDQLTAISKLVASRM
ncbi:MAG: hypothetical protein OEW15_05500 [Nitrospirota bacterium]|nr:hypothetical protein [Nitrospirota bacterium]